MAVPPEDATDRLLGGRYWLESVLGHGGMATVYRARDEVLGRSVAVKLFTQGSAIDTGRQESELSVLAGLNHHGLVNLLDAGVDTDQANLAHRYIVTELVRGSDLQARLSRGPLAPRHVAEIGYDIAEALEYIHSHGVIHRDIKPSNIMLVDYGDDAPRARAKLTDFGIALSEDVERLTRDNATTGTAAYLSPEQASGAHVSDSSDVYSLGLVLLECVTRRVEFPGTLVESAMARLSRQPLIPADLPEHWRSLLEAMTARKPADRPPRRELVSALRQVVMAESARHKDAEPALMPARATGRIETIESFGVLDIQPDASVDRVTTMAARLFSAPVSVVCIVDRDRILFTSHHGLEREQIAAGFDSYRSLAELTETWVIEDARHDARTAANALVTSDFGLQFFVGTPLRTSDGIAIGTLSVLDFHPRTVTSEEVDNLRDLAALVMSQLELRRDTFALTGEIGRAASPPIPAIAPA